LEKGKKRNKGSDNLLRKARQGTGEILGQKGEAGGEAKTGLRKARKIDEDSQEEVPGN